MKKDAVKIKGFFRLQIEDGPSGKIVGDSGWIENQVTNLGYKLYLADNIGKSSGSKQIGYVALGTGAAPASDATTLPGEIMLSTQRKAVTYANVASTTAQFTATFASADSFLTGASNLSNIGLFATTSTTDTIFAGNTYTSSSCNTNQNVNVTKMIGHVKPCELLENPNVKTRAISSQASIEEGSTTIPQGSRLEAIANRSAGQFRNGIDDIVYSLVKAKAA